MASIPLQIIPQEPKSFHFGREVWGWGLYDFANTIFSMNILTLYFASWVILDHGVADIWYSITFSFSMLLAALSMPVLGAVADAGGKKKKYLLILTLGCIAATFVIGVVATSNIALGQKLTLALISFAVANYCFEGALVFYNALLPDVSHHRRMGQISGLGVGLGYLGAVAGMLLVLPFVQGKVFPGVAAGKPQAFIPTAILFLLFCLPTFLWVRKDRRVSGVKVKLDAAFKEVWKDLVNTKKYPGVLRFLISDFMFEDAIATVILFMAVYTQAVMGFGEGEKTLLFLISTTSAALGSIACGWVTDRLGPKRTLSFVVWGWIISLVVISLTSSRLVFWILASLVGIFLGSTWTASRPLLAHLVPKEKLGQFFGLYCLSGRSAAIMGPLIWGLVVLYFRQDHPLVEALTSLLQHAGLNLGEAVLATIQYRLAVLALALIMLIGWVLYRKVPDKRS